MRQHYDSKPCGPLGSAQGNATHGSAAAKRTTRKPALSQRCPAQLLVKCALCSTSASVVTLRAGHVAAAQPWSKRCGPVECAQGSAAANLTRYVARPVKRCTGASPLTLPTGPQLGACEFPPSQSGQLGLELRRQSAERSGLSGQLLRGLGAAASAACCKSEYRTNQAAAGWRQRQNRSTSPALAATGIASGLNRPSRPPCREGWELRAS